MKPKPFKFRYVNEIVGGFVLLVLLIVVAGVFVAGKSQEWFVPVHEIAINFPPQGSLGLQVGADVQIMGTSVGRITEISVDEDGFMTGVMTVKGDFIRYVRTDSEVKAKKKFGVAGDSYIEITKGDGPMLPPDAAVVVTADTDITELIEEILNQFQEKTFPVIESVKAALDEYRGLAEDLRAPDKELQMLLANLNAILAGLREGEGAAGRLLSDQATAEQVSSLLTQVNEILARVQDVLANVQAAADRLPAMAETVEGEVRQIPGTVIQTQDTLRETERLIEGIQRHWLIRRYVPHDQTASDMIPSDQVIPPAGRAPLMMDEETMP